MAESPFQGGFEEIQPYFVDIIPDRDPVHLPEGVGNVKPVESGEFFQLGQGTVPSVLGLDDLLDGIDDAAVAGYFFRFPPVDGSGIMETQDQQGEACDNGIV